MLDKVFPMRYKIKTERDGDFESVLRLLAERGVPPVIALRRRRLVSVEANRLPPSLLKELRARNASVAEDPQYALENAASR